MAQKQYQLKFSKEGKFKILQLTDLHVGNDVNDKSDQKTFNLIDYLIKKEKPDFVVFTGDIIWSEGIKNSDDSFRKVMDHVSAWEIPFAVIYGNHDTEGGLSREELHSVLAEYPLSLSKAGPKKVTGVGNYSLTVKSSSGNSDEFILYFLDSGAYAPENIGGYDWIKQDQVNWYIQESKERQHSEKKSIPALAFFHIPLPEYDDLWRHSNVSGTKNEAVSSPKINSGMFTGMIEAEDVIGTFAGHDHDNDYCGNLHGISLCFGRVSGYNCYGDLQRGARVIELTEQVRGFNTWIHTDDGKITQSYKHEV